CSSSAYPPESSGTSPRRENPHRNESCPRLPAHRTWSASELSVASTTSTSSAAPRRISAPIPLPPRWERLGEGKPVTRANRLRCPKDSEDHQERQTLGGHQNAKLTRSWSAPHDAHGFAVRHAVQ